MRTHRDKNREFGPREQQQIHDVLWALSEPEDSLSDPEMDRVRAVQARVRESLASVEADKSVHSHSPLAQWWRWNPRVVLIAAVTACVAIAAIEHEHILERFRYEWSRLHTLSDVHGGLRKDTGLGPWKVLQELVKPRTECYADEVGGVYDSDTVTAGGHRSLMLWSNEKRDRKSNHLVAIRQISSQPLAGRTVLSLRALIDPETASSGETGPDFRLQTVAWDPVTNRTITYAPAIQYRANPTLQPRCQWAVWTRLASGVSGWKAVAVQCPRAGQWLAYELAVDFTSLRYAFVSLAGTRIDLSGYSIPADDADKMSTGSFVAVDVENMWNNCGDDGGVYSYKVYYDDIAIKPFPRNGALPARQ